MSKVTWLVNGRGGIKTQTFPKPLCYNIFQEGIRGVGVGRVKENILGRRNHKLKQCRNKKVGESDELGLDSVAKV